MVDPVAHKDRRSPRMLEQKVLGFDLPASTVTELVSRTHAPLVDEGWLQAMLGPAVVWITVWFIAVASVYLPGMPAADSARLSAQLRVGAGLGLLATFAWAWWYSRYRRLPSLDVVDRAAALQRLMGWHRLHTLLLALLFGGGAIFQAWMISPGLGLFALLAAVGLLAAGYRWTPLVLRFIAGESKRALQAAGIIDLLLLLLTGLVAGGALGIPWLRGLPSVAVMFSLTALAAVFLLPVAAALLAWAMLHFRAARTR